MSCHRYHLLCCTLLHLLSTFAPSLCECQESLGLQRVAAGTRIVARIGPKANETWVFGRIQDIAVDRQGRLFVLDASDQKIRVFDASGLQIRVLGGLGRGPGEFFRASRLEVVKDTLWVSDNANARLTALSTATGAVLRSTRAQPYDQFLAGVSGTGTFVVKPDGMVDATSTRPVVVRFEHQQAGVRGRRQVAEILVTRPPFMFRTFAGDAKQPLGVAHTVQPLDDGWLHQTGPDGRSIVLVERTPQRSSASVFGAPSTASMRVVEIGWKGDTLRDRRYRVPSRRVTSDDIDAIVKFTANPGVIVLGREVTANYAEVRDSLYKPTAWPPVIAFFVGLDGSMWFQQPQPPNASARFWRLAADGTEMIPVVLSSKLRVVRVSSNRIWGIAEDADGVQTVHVLDVVSPRGNPR